MTRHHARRRARLQLAAVIAISAIMIGVGMILASLLIYLTPPRPVYPTPTITGNYRTVGQR